MKTLACRCAFSDVIDKTVRRTVLGLLAASEREVEFVDDLCALAERHDPLLREVVAEEGLTIVACRPRAIRWLFERGGSTLPPSVRVIDMRALTAEDAAEALGLEAGATVAPVDVEPQDPPEGWAPWYPVVDGDRCRRCGQCAAFCLFGVYESDAEGGVRVTNPRNCKNHCPACARICPAGAIIFPKVPESTIDGGDVPDDWKPVRPEEARKPRGGLRQRLVERNRARLLRDEGEAPERGAKE